MTEESTFVLTDQEKTTLRVCADTWTARMANKHLYNILVQLGDLSMVLEGMANPFAMLSKDLIALLVDWIYGKPARVRNARAMMDPVEHLLEVFPEPDRREKPLRKDVLGALGNVGLRRDPEWIYALLRVFRNHPPVEDGPIVCELCKQVQAPYDCKKEGLFQIVDICVLDGISKRELWALQQLRGCYCNICAVASAGLVWLGNMGQGGNGYFCDREILVRAFPSDLEPCVKTWRVDFVTHLPKIFYSMLQVDRVRVRKEAAYPGRRVPEDTD